MARLEPFFPESRGKPRVHDKRVLSGIIFINPNGLRWRDAPKEYGPHKTLYNRWKRWSDKGIFARMMVGLAADHDEQTTVMIDATIERRPVWASKKGRGRLIGQVDWLLGDRGYDADWFKDALKDKGMRACIPRRKQRKKNVKYDKRRYRIEIMFGRLKDWRRVATR